ncbi:LysM peptidoglycan-binding domain-containing protein [Roseateles sp. DB2]|uniref:LysM peptidoglycan-binding domain-containing protein n=1 Tax=Roseateles sp. DB2 TaxID=3453717 RepID=UPI003EE9D171
MTSWPMLRPAPLATALWAAAALVGTTPALATDFPVTQTQRDTAQKVAQAGVPLSELAPNAPDSYTVKKGDTLWAISTIFLKTPWRWPELWGMNQDQIRNPHLIYPGQHLVLVKVDGRARLELAQAVSGPTGTVKLSPRARVEQLDDGGIPAIPLNLIEPFLNEAVVLDEDSLATAPRVAATQEGRVLLSRGDLAYVRGTLPHQGDYRVFRSAKPLRDPLTKEVLGYEAAYVGTMEFLRPGTPSDGKTLEVPATFRVKQVRQEVNTGDRLAPVPPRNFNSYVPHAPTQPIEGRVIAVYGEAVNAGQNQIVSINKGTQDGVERGHVLALWRTGQDARDTTGPGRPETIRLPDERHGRLFVFQSYRRVSYALILSVQQPVSAGDRFTQP